MKVRLRFALFLIAAMGSGSRSAAEGAGGGGDLLERRQELNTIRQQIEKNRGEVQKLSSRETDISSRLQKIDQSVTLLNNYISKMGEAEGAMGVEIDSIKDDLGRAGRTLTSKKDFLNLRIRYIYMRGRIDKLDMVFGARSFSDFLKRYNYFRKITDNDRRLINGIFEQKRKIEREKGRLESRLTEMRSLRRDKELEKKRQDAQKRVREKLLREVKGKKKNYQKMVAGLEARQREMSQLIEALEEARRRALQTEKKRPAMGDGLAKGEGRLPWPLRGKIIKKFGINVNQKYGTKTVNNGIDIEASPGEAVSSVAAGKVAHVGDLGGFGNFVIVEHDGGFYSVYANLAGFGVQKGETVGAGQVLGQAGDTGSFDGVKLHFELRRERKILDPLKWLSK